MERATTRNDPWWQRIRRHAVGIAAFEALAVAGGLAGLSTPRLPWWSAALAFLGACALIAWVYTRFPHPTRRDLHVRAGLHVVSLATVLHLAGWSSLLVPIYLLAASDLQRSSGLPVGRLVVAWAAGAVAVGHAGILLLDLPSVVDPALGTAVAAGGLLSALVVIKRFEDDERELQALAARAERRSSRLRTVLDGAPTAVLIVEAGRPVLASPRVAEVLGLLDDEHLVDQIEHRVHPDDIGVMRDALRHSESVGRRRLRFRRGDDVWVELDVSWNDAEGGHETVLHVRDVTTESRRQAELEHIALIDPLTGLSNRRQLDRRLPQVCARVDRDGQAAAVLFIDLDGFKHVNDTHGHGVGDLVLRHVARDIRAEVRAEDTVARYGGDEFVVLVETLTPAANPHELAARLVEVVGRCRSVGSTSIEVGASVGVRRIGAGDLPETVIMDADAAMYRAKRGANDSVVDHDEVHAPESDDVTHPTGGDRGTAASSAVPLA